MGDPFTRRRRIGTWGRERAGTLRWKNSRGPPARLAMVLDPLPLRRAGRTPFQDPAEVETGTNSRTMFMRRRRMKGSACMIWTVGGTRVLRGIRARISTCPFGPCGTVIIRLPPYRSRPNRGRRQNRVSLPMRHPAGAVSLGVRPLETWLDSRGSSCPMEARVRTRERKEAPKVRTPIPRGARPRKKKAEEARKGEREREREGEKV